MLEKQIEAFLISYLEYLRDEGQEVVNIQEMIDKIKVSFHKYDFIEDLLPKQDRYFQKILRTL